LRFFSSSIEVVDATHSQGRAAPRHAEPGTARSSGIPLKGSPSPLAIGGGLHEHREAARRRLDGQGSGRDVWSQ
jgi:hypothetical protein